MSIKRRSILTLICSTLLAGLLGACNASDKATLTTAKLDTAKQDAAELKERFLTPRKGVAALVINERGEIVVVTADGKTAEPCALPGDDGKTSATRLPLCHAAKGTDVLKVAPVTIMRNTGSQCMTFFYPADGQMRAFQYCW